MDTIRQILIRVDNHGPTLIAKSENVSFADENQALTLIAQLVNPHPSSTPKTETLEIFKHRFDRNCVVIGQSNGVQFRLLIIPNHLYQHYSDPFAISDHYPPDWKQQSLLPTLVWDPPELTWPRVEELQLRLQKGQRSPLLLGCTQALIDGSRVLIPQTMADESLLRDLWQLLPVNSRPDLNLATHTDSTLLGFHIAVMPTLPDQTPNGYITADQACDYPEGRYELGIQSAIESADQAEYQRLRNRHSNQEVLRLGIMIVVISTIIALVSKYLI